MNDVGLMKTRCVSAFARRLLRLGATGFFLFLAAGCVSPGGPDGLNAKAGAATETEVRSQMSLTPDEWRMARKYAGVARDFYGYDYIPARVERYSDSGDAIVVDLAFRMPDGRIRRVRVTGTRTGKDKTEERWAATVRPLSPNPSTP